MPETDDMIDFRRFADEVAACVRPDYADVAARARRYRSRRTAFSAGAIAVALAGGGTAIAVSGDSAPIVLQPDPTLSPSVVRPAGPWRTTVPENGKPPQPLPSFIEVMPGSYDVAEADKPLTGLWTELRAGDLDHLYLEYQNCTGGNCQRMLAVSSDRGRTWQKLPMPWPVRATSGPADYDAIVLAYGTLLLAVPGDGDRSEYWTSTDAGGTWRQVQVRSVEALPAGWPIQWQDGEVIAIDPATGDIVRKSVDYSRMVLDLPPEAGLWALHHVGDGASSSIVAEVSRDGGRSWETRQLPAWERSADGVAKFGRSLLATTNGQTVYLQVKTGDGVQIHASGDGGRTWTTGALVDLDGPMLSFLAVDDRTVIVAGPKGTFRSTDQGQTFTRVGDALGGGGQAIPGGFTIPTTNNEYSAWISPDGADWTYISRPDVP